MSFKALPPYDFSIIEKLFISYLVQSPHIVNCLSLKSHQNFCSKSVPTWPPESALRAHLGPLGQSCVSVCQQSSHVCEPALFHHLNSPAAFTR